MAVCGILTPGTVAKHPVRVEAKDKTHTASKIRLNIEPDAGARIWEHENNLEVRRGLRVADLAACASVIDSTIGEVSNVAEDCRVRMACRRILRTMDTPKDESGKPVPAFEVVKVGPPEVAGDPSDSTLSPEEREAAAQFLRESFRVLPKPEKTPPKSVR